jgi:hypothetical protein
MSVFVCAISAMSVALLYSTWRAHFEQTVQRHRQLRERVAYMLWVMANTAPEGK